tara:strand:+ start:2386 stop:2901 length:516 start_codon:yes stop_codon:yes gene_type:complete
MKLKKTNKRLRAIGQSLVKGLRDELKAQKHNATGNLSRSLMASYRYGNRIKSDTIKLDILTNLNKNYWKVVNKASRWTFKASYAAIARWVKIKGINPNATYAIYKKLTDRYYGKPYIFWQEGNRLRRENFAGFALSKQKDQIMKEIQSGVKGDVIDAIRESIKKNIPNSIV